MYPMPLYKYSLPTVNNSHHPTVHELKLTHLSPSMSIVYIGFPLGVVYFMGFDKSIICLPLAHHYHITQSGFTALNGLCAPSACLSLP